MEKATSLIHKYNSHENRLADCIRFLTIDAVENAKSGHPGMPMGMADFMTVLYKDFLRFNPNDPNWRNRDRVVISNGHGSMLLYSLLFLTGYKDITIEDIKNFRKINSKTTGHPEFGELSGVETTTGPLGQGIANAVGMAIAAKNSKESICSEINHKVYCTVGDGCLMEGISHEAISFASNYGLDNLVVIFDDNGVTIDGRPQAKESQVERFAALGWDVFEIDGHNTTQIQKTLSIINSGKLTKPVFISCKTIIGFGDFKNQGTPIVHGSQIEKESVDVLKSLTKWKQKSFDIGEKYLSEWRSFWLRNKKYYESDSSKKHEKFITKNTIDHLEKNISYLKNYHISDVIKSSTRKSLLSFVDSVEDLGAIMYGSADLGESTCIKSKRSMELSDKSHRGNYINFGIREHAMAAISNGISLYGDKIPVISTFLVFSDYMRPAIRMSAQMNQKIIYIFTHDSILLGQDGPTHQPIEHLDSLRLMPNLNVFRPSSVIEFFECMQIAITKNSPSCLVLSRQEIDLSISSKLVDDYRSKNLSEKGGYLIEKRSNNPQITIISTGSEVGLAQKTAKILSDDSGVVSNVASIPCVELFKNQTQEYQKSVLSEDSFLVFIELSNSNSFDIFIAKNGMKICISSFGKSGSMLELIEDFDISPSSCAKKILSEFRKSI